MNRYTRNLVPAVTAIGISPTFGNLNLSEAAVLLQGLYLTDIVQLQGGTPGILSALVPKQGIRRIRYIRKDPREQWRTVRHLWIEGGGDCEDLAAAVAAELTIKGIPAMPVVYRVRPGLAHAVVRTGDGKILDPSRLGGMGETPAGGVRYSRFYRALEAFHG